MKFSKVTNPRAIEFLEEFFGNREINREYYQKVPEDKFDFRMIDKPDQKSDSPRESLAHQINVQRSYLIAEKTGKLRFKVFHDKELKKKSKNELLTELGRVDQKLINILADDKKLIKKIGVPWSKAPVSLVEMFWGLVSHEVLHTGWNLAIMDHLGIKRFPKLQERWGK
jgi:uncharacterized damage-inducible protein DinB